MDTFTLGGINYDSKTANERVKKILNNQGFNTAVSNQDLDFLKDLLCSHSQNNRIDRQGIKTIIVSRKRNPLNQYIGKKVFKAEIVNRKTPLYFNGSECIDKISNDEQLQLM